MTVELIRVDGTRVAHVLNGAGAMRRICELIGAETLDVVNLRDGRVMLVDDTGMIDGRPVNPEATKIYHSIYCTHYSIHGDAVIAVDKDFA